MRPGTAPLLLCLCLGACASAPRPASPGEGPRDVLGGFLAAVDRGDMEAAYDRLSGRWRARLSPTRLREDLESGGALARDRLERARLAARSDPVIEDGLAAFPIGDGRSVRLRREPGGWKVDALE